MSVRTYSGVPGPVEVSRTVFVRPVTTTTVLTVQAFMWGAAALVVLALVALVVLLVAVLVVAGVIIVAVATGLAIRDAIRDRRATPHQQAMMVPTDQPQEER